MQLSNDTLQVHINSTSFSAVAAVNLDDVFSGDYKVYKIIFWTDTKSTTSGLTMRLRAIGSDNTTSNYETTFPGGSTTTATSWAITDANNNKTHSFNTDIFNPSHAQNTFTNPSEGRGFSTTAVTNLSGFLLIKRDTLIFDGLSVIVSTGTMTGTITIFAYSEG